MLCAGLQAGGGFYAYVRQSILCLKRKLFLRFKKFNIFISRQMGFCPYFDFFFSHGKDVLATTHTTAIGFSVDAHSTTTST